MAEQSIVEQVRKILMDKGYPDPANNGKADSFGLRTYAQDDYKKNIELEGLLKHASKNHDEIWSDKASYGKPEFIIVNDNTNLAIVIECKSSDRNHISKYLRDNKLMKDKKIINRNACDGALHYGKFLGVKYNVICIGVSKSKSTGALIISTYYWDKSKSVETGELRIKRTVNKKEITESVEYCFGPFVDLNLDNLQSYQYYEQYIEKQSNALFKAFSEKEAKDAATNLNVFLDGASVSTTVRAILVSGLLLALRDATFKQTYKDKNVDEKKLVKNLNSAIEDIIDNSDIEDDFKKNVLKTKFKDAFNQQDLLDKNAQKLRMVIDKLNASVFPLMNMASSVDVIGQFYHEFLSYAPSGQNNGIKLTPNQITDLFCDLADIKVTDKIVDICLGTGGFLISGMNRLYNLAEELDEKGIDDFFQDKIDLGEITKSDIEDIRENNYRIGKGKVLTIDDVHDYIRKHQLVGCENDNIMYTLGCSNMIIRGDGKSNIILGDCFKREEELKDFKADVGLMNPPYSGSAYPILSFVDLLCRVVKKGSRVVVIVPTSCAHSGDPERKARNELLKNNTLLGVMSMNEELFKGIADTITCIMVFQAGIPHDFNKSVYFGNWKEDGYYWRKSQRIPDNDREKFSKTPEEYKNEWLNSFNNINIDDDYGIWRKLTKDSDGICYDEWLWESFVETDYSQLTQSDFEEVVKNFVIHQLKQSSLNRDDDVNKEGLR